MRAYLALDRSFALTARLSTALASPGREASVGVAINRGPVRLLFERRLALDRGGRNDWSVTAATGFDNVALPARFRLDGYAQAGVVGRDGFADGALRAERTVASFDDTRISAGAGAWAAIQPRLSRVDVGPQLIVRTPLAGQTIRLSAEWRSRIAGNASPRSGPVIAVATDF